MLPSPDTQINPQNTIWEGIVHCWATPEQIISFLDTYMESDDYLSLSNHDQLEFGYFKRLLEDTLVHTPIFELIYNYIEYRLGHYGWNLQD